MGSRHLRFAAEPVPRFPDPLERKSLQDEAGRDVAREAGGVAQSSRVAASTVRADLPSWTARVMGPRRLAALNLPSFDRP